MPSAQFPADTLRGFGFHSLLAPLPCSRLLQGACLSAFAPRRLQSSAGVPVASRVFAPTSVCLPVSQSVRD